MHRNKVPEQRRAITREAVDRTMTKINQDELLKDELRKKEEELESLRAGLRKKEQELRQRDQATDKQVSAIAKAEQQRRSE